MSTRVARRLYRSAILCHYQTRIQPLMDQLTISNLRRPTSAALEASLEVDLAEPSCYPEGFDSPLGPGEGDFDACLG